MSRLDLVFVAHGTPAPQGSHKAFINRRTGRPIITQDNKRTLPWREAVKHAAFDAMPDGWQPITGPVSVAMTLYMPRPKGHYGSGRNAQTLKDSAPAYPTTKPDADKCARAVCDALTDAGAYRDDSQVVELEVLQRYADAQAPCAHIRVTDLTALAASVMRELDGVRDYGGAVKVIDDDGQATLL